MGQIIACPLHQHAGSLGKASNVKSQAIDLRLLADDHGIDFIKHSLLKGELFLQLDETVIG